MTEERQPAGSNVAAGGSCATSAGVLVLGYGNELRGDDGAGPRVVEEIQAAGWPGVEGLVVAQLTPELAEEMAKRAVVVFVDASVGQAEVTVRGLTPAEGRSPWGHRCDPEGLLNLAQVLYGRCPQAWLVTVPGEKFDLGAGLSPKARAGVQEARAQVRVLCEGFTRR